MGKSKPFINRKTASVYRLVHPTVQGDTEPLSSDGGNTAESDQAKAKITPVFQKIRGEVDYFSEEEEEYPYREDSGDEDENGEGHHEEDYDEEDEFGDEDMDGEDVFDEGSEAQHGDGTGSEAKRNVWIRSKQETMSEYSSWSSRSASSYLPPARRRQLWRDIEEFGLPDDGYDYTQHLRNAGAGVRIDAKLSSDLMAILERKRQHAENKLTRAEKEVISLLYESDEEKKDRNLNPVEENDQDSDDEAPPLDGEHDDGTNTGEIPLDKLEKLEHGIIVEEGDALPDDFFLQMMEDNESWEAGSATSSVLSRPQRLVDDQFDVMLKKYDESEVGELPDEHPGLQGHASVESYYNILDQYIAACKPAKIGEEDDTEPVNEVEEDSMDEEDRAELIAKTKALVMASNNGESSDDSNELEEVEAEEHEDWDCESILSTYSNLYNHPALIRDRRAPSIKIDPRTGAPVTSKPPVTAMESALDKEEEEEEEEEDGKSVGGEALARRKDETKEEKQARKQAAKAAKAKALEKKREAKEMRGAQPRTRPNAFDPRTRPGLSLKHID